MKQEIKLQIEVIQVKVPHHLDGVFTRLPFQDTHRHQQLLTYEYLLRKEAYKNTTIQVDEAFFDDSDMVSDYFLIVVYDQLSDTPLLSARYYFNKELISKTLRGDEGQKPKLLFENKPFSVNDREDGEIFLADRLSGNMENEIYQTCRTAIFNLFHWEIAKRNSNAMLLLMVRDEPDNRQISKYLNLGFSILGSTMHKTKLHHIVALDLKHI